METYQQLEEEFGQWAGVANVVACASGTAALHLGLEALRLPPAAEVVIPDFGMVACARAVTLAGLSPVFVDCGDDLLLDPDAVDETCEDQAGNVRAIMAVHTYGRRCPMTELAALAQKYNLAMIEDLAEAHGVRPHLATDAACWSFYRNKIIAGEEGGAVAFRDPAHAELARKLRSLGFTDAHDFTHLPRGHNYRMSNAHAHLIRESLAAVEGNLERRWQAEVWYGEHCPAGWRLSARDAPWVYDLRIPGLTTGQQDEAVRELKRVGIEARHGFKPLSAQEEYRTAKLFGGGGTEVLAREVLYLPLTPGLVTEASARQAFVTLYRSLRGLRTA